MSSNRPSIEQQVTFLHAQDLAETAAFYENVLGLKKESLLKQTTAAPLLPVRFSVLLVLAEEFISRRWWRMKSSIVKVVTLNYPITDSHVFKIHL